MNHGILIGADVDGQGTRQMTRVGAMLVEPRCTVIAEATQAADQFVPNFDRHSARKNSTPNRDRTDSGIRR